MYEFTKPHNGEYKWGRYFSAVPSFPLTEGGKPFRFAFVTNNDTMDDLVTNLEHRTNEAQITTTYNYDWTPDGAVLIDGTLYKIQDGITSEVIHQQSYSLMKQTRKRYTLRLKDISNPIKLGR